MRHRKSGRHFSRTAAHRNSMLDTLATQLLDHEAIQTTEAKAKELRSVVEKLITLAKVDTVHTRRLAASRLNQRAVNRNLAGAELVAELKTANSVLNKLFDDIAKRNANRPGGYTRIIKLGNRHGDNAPMVRIELVEKAVPAGAKPAIQLTTAD